MSKKEVRLIFNLEQPKEKELYEFVINKSVTTAYIKDMLHDVLKGELVNKSQYEELINQIVKNINTIEPQKNDSSLTVEIDVNGIIEDLNDFED